ncbi:MAG: HAMP domain-containing histidine kinase [bacterium]|nr:HAMP domain-containing histidine kinase [bacterium]
MSETAHGQEKVKKKEYRIRFDESGQILGGSLHASLGEQLGIVLDGCVDKTVFDYLPKLAVLDPDLGGRVDRRVRRLLDDRREFSIYGDFEASGKTFHLHISGRAIRNYDGTLVFTLLFLDDTEHTQLRRQYEYMFRLANHELKSPLACILGAADFAEEHLAAGNIDGIKTCLKMLHRNTEVMEDLITRYLTLSRIESGHLMVSPADITFSADVLSPIIRELQPTLLAKRMDVSLEGVQEKREPVIHADPEALTIVLRNLLSNAVKYGEPGSTVRVEFRLSDDGAAIAVANKGAGIPEAHLKRLFNKFVRLEATQGTKGAGLGLYNARKVVELWGGEITVQSEEDRIRFEFTIPQE